MEELNVTGIGDVTVDDVIWFENNRNVILDRFVNKIKRNSFTDEEYHKFLESLLRVNKQLKMIRDITIIQEAIK